MSELMRIHTNIEGRVSDIRSAHPDWLCAKGCDTCCRRLAELPRLTKAEWGLLRPALAALPGERLVQIRREVAAAAEKSSGLVVCPLLDQPTGACPVYVQRELGLYCGDIEVQVAGCHLPDVV